MRARVLMSCIAAAAAVLAGCAGERQLSAPEPEPQPDQRPADEAPDDAPEPWDGFDRATSRAEAEALLGLPEDQVEESAQVRIVRRGDERFIVTMDLRPGRRNVELDDDGTGTYVVTRVVVEVPDDEDPLIVE